MPDPLADLRKCKRCKQQFDLTSRRPKFLVCHHCFCMQCIQALITTKVNQTTPCPTCNKITCIGRNGVASLPDNEYILPQLQQNSQSEIFCSDSEDDGDYGDGFLDEASGGHMLNGNGPSQAGVGVKIFCETCLKVASSACLTQHRICNYDQGITSLKFRLKTALDQAGENLSNEVQFLEENCKYLERVQNCWASLGEQLHQSIIAHTMNLTSAKSLLDRLPDLGLGSPMAKAGDPSVLVKVVLDTEETVTNSSSRLTNTKNITNIWRAVSNCNVNLQTPVNVKLNSTFSIDLHDRTKDDIICLMFSLSKMLETKLKQTDQSNKENVNHEVPKCSKENETLVQHKSPTDFKLVTTTKKIVKTIHAGIVFCYFDLKQGNCDVGRVVFEINCKAAPRMAKNFIELCTGEHGYGFANTKLWKTSFGDHVDGGDLPEGGDCSIYDRKPFYGDTSNVPDGLGMLRMRGRGTSQTGQAIVGSQFMVWTKDRPFKNYTRTLVFGKVRDGLDVLANMPETKPKKGKPFVAPVSIVKCGILK